MTGATYTWRMDAELAALVQTMAEETGRSWEQIAHGLLANGLAYAMAHGLQSGATTNRALAERIARFQASLAHGMTVEIHELEFIDGEGRT